MLLLSLVTLCVTEYCMHLAGLYGKACFLLLWASALSMHVVMHAGTSYMHGEHNCNALSNEKLL